MDIDDRVGQVIYVSSSCGQMSESELERLLTAAREKNSALGITGMLLYVGDNFIQALEGQKKALDAVLQSIKSDPRHADFRIVLRSENVRRDYVEWSMGYCRCEPAELVPLGYLVLAGTPIESPSFSPRIARGHGFSARFTD